MTEEEMHDALIAKLDEILVKAGSTERAAEANKVLLTTIEAHLATAATREATSEALVQRIANALS